MDGRIGEIGSVVGKIGSVVKRVKNKKCNMYIFDYAVKMPSCTKDIRVIITLVFKPKEM